MTTIRHHHAVISAEHTGMRLDQALAAIFTDYSRSALKSWIDAGQVTCNSTRCRPRQRVRAGDTVDLTATLEAHADALPEPVEFRVVHEDRHLIVVDKPAGVVVHPGAGNPSGTLVNGLLHRFPELAMLPRAGLAHRLDKETSGLLVVARTTAALNKLTKQLSRREVKRVYSTLVNGVIVAGGTIDEPIGRDPANRTRMRVRAGGRPAVSHFRVLERFRAHTYLEVRLETGRTHQIRVHLSTRGHPVVSDSRYGGRRLLPKAPNSQLVAALQSLRRHALHAKSLVFRHPHTGEQMTFDSPLPADFERVLSALRADAKRADA